MESLDSQDVSSLRGLITDRDLGQAEVEFPGICRFYAARRGTFRTFLELMVAFVCTPPTRAATGEPSPP